jgi:CheY-like chemotaxis protein
MDSRQTTVESQVEPGRSVEPEQAYVLVVEDDPSIRMLAGRILQFNGISHGLAVDGFDGLAQIAARRPDVVLMDLSMPGLDGWGAISRLRQDPANGDVYVVALTAHAMAGDDERALAAGFNAVLTKPYLPADLVRTVKRALERIATGRPT